MMKVNTIPDVMYSVTAPEGEACTVAAVVNGVSYTLAEVCKGGQACFQAVAGEVEVSSSGAIVRALVGQKDPSAADAQVARMVDSALYEDAEVKPQGNEEDNYNAYGFVCVITQTGKVDSLKIECRYDDGKVTPRDTPMWVKVWRGSSTLLAASENSQVHAQKEVLLYTFKEPIDVEAGDELRVSFHTAEGLSTTAYQMGPLPCCMRVVRLLDGEGGGMLGADGGYMDEGWVAKYVWHMEVRHAKDTTAHLTADEHAALSELLARKDELLALMEAASTQQEV